MGLEDSGRRNAHMDAVPNTPQTIVLMVEHLALVRYVEAFKEFMLGIFLSA